MFGLSLIPSVASTSSVIPTGTDTIRQAPYSNTYSIQLDGVDDVIPLGLSDAQMDALHQGDFSVSFWIRRKSWTTSYLFGFNQLSGTANAFWIRYLTIGSSYLQTSVTHNGSSHSGLSPITTPAVNTWVHVAASVKKGIGSAQGTAKFYINGSQVVSQTTATGTNQAAADIEADFDYVVGAVQTHATPTYTGYTKANFDEVALWNDALTPAEITAIYNSGSTFSLKSDNGDYTSSANLQYYYRFENNFSDAMSNAGDATNPSGGATFSNLITPP